MKNEKKQQDTIKKNKLNQKENSRYEKMHEQNQLKRQTNIIKSTWCMYQVSNIFINQKEFKIKWNSTEQSEMYLIGLQQIFKFV